MIALSGAFAVLVIVLGVATTIAAAFYVFEDDLKTTQRQRAGVFALGCLTALVIAALASFSLNPA
jgi:hypothetical protein